MDDVIIYTADGCPPCVTLKQRLKEEKIPFKEKKLGKDISLEEYPYKVVPVVEVKNRVLEGYCEEHIDIIKKLLEEE